jgi:hypothetical protein
MDLTAGLRVGRKQSHISAMSLSKKKKARCMNFLPFSFPPGQSLTKTPHIKTFVKTANTKILLII